MTDTELDALREFARALSRRLDLERARRQVGGVPIIYTRQHPDGTAGECYVIYLKDLVATGIPAVCHEMRGKYSEKGKPCAVYESHAAALDDLAQAWIKVYGGDL